MAPGNHWKLSQRFLRYLYQFDPAFDAVRADPLFRVEPRAAGGGDSVRNM
jgi:hypothetical protein